MIIANNVNELNREQLLTLLNNYAKNWLAHDGCWFLSIEEKLGMDSAMDFDRESWRKFTVIEAKRLIKFLELNENSGLEGLSKALLFRLYSTLNEDRVEFVDDKTIRYYVKTCRVQAARRRKGLSDFPCKSVGIVEYSYFAKTIDMRFETKCVSCSPEISDDEHYCVWEFTLIIK